MEVATGVKRKTLSLQTLVCYIRLGGLRVRPDIAMRQANWTRNATNATAACCWAAVRAPHVAA
jgi:hypothetical protein